MGSNLPILVVEHSSFQNLIHLVNNQACLMLNHISQKTISSHVTKMYVQLQQKVKLDVLERQPTISFTHNVWTAPNITAFMAGTAHFINKNFKMVDLTIAHLILGKTLPVCFTRYFKNTKSSGSFM
ncbi:uncharacterized protein VP01_1019g8 [Puccinia sorghi]|uniref:Uncharacterized protein n=1 Tax=Puccinia sorghi TaxID=27349 RepID=A0A0L6VV90_9BASI|nr:uncharacterized protein VP01_1019g8 [Puccinia sorghi]